MPAAMVRVLSPNFGSHNMPRGKIRGKATPNQGSLSRKGQKGSLNTSPHLPTKKGKWSHFSPLGIAGRAGNDVCFSSSATAIPLSEENNREEIRGKTTNTTTTTTPIEKERAQQILARLSLFIVRRHRQSSNEAADK